MDQSAEAANLELVAAAVRQLQLLAVEPAVARLCDDG